MDQFRNIGTEIADIHQLYESDFYRVLDFKCRCRDCGTSSPEYSNTFSISFVRKGNFLFNVFRHSLDSYTGCVLVTKPGYERTVTHVHEIPDECTIFDFKNEFYQEILEKYPSIRFLFDNDLHSTLVKINPETEYLHYRIVSTILSKSGPKLEIDSLVMELMDTVFSRITDYKPDFEVHDRTKSRHLITIERAKNYINEHFHEDISLMEIASNSFVSPFHFSRLFKTLTSYSPHQFLLNIRLKNAEVLLKNTSMPVSSIAFASGFNSIEHFGATFNQKYHQAPSSFRSTVPV